MKRVVVILLMLTLAGCGSNKEFIVEKPTKPSDEIERVEISQSVNEDMLVENESKLSIMIEEAKPEVLIDSQKEIIKHIEFRLSNNLSELEKLDRTLVYNDIFRVVDGVGIFIEEHESIFTKDLFVHGFSRKMSEVLTTYKDEFYKDAIFLAVAPFAEGVDKHVQIAVFYSRETLDKLNFDKLVENEEYFYRQADTVWRNYHLEDQLNERGIYNQDDLFLEYRSNIY